MSFTYAMADFIDYRTRKYASACGASRAGNHPASQPQLQNPGDRSTGRFLRRFATDIVRRIKQALDEGRPFVGISRSALCRNTR